MSVELAEKEGASRVNNVLFDVIERGEGSFPLEDDNQRGSLDREESIYLRLILSFQWVSKQVKDEEKKEEQVTTRRPAQWQPQKISLNQLLLLLLFIIYSNWSNLYKHNLVSR